MSRRTTEVYRRGKYWLAWDKRADGALRSPYLAIFWYDAAARRTRSRSSGEAAVEEAILALDRLYLADRDEAPAYCPTCGQPTSRARDYLLADAISDYRLEVGDGRDSGDTIAARLKHVLDFLEAEQLEAATCEEATRPAFVDRFRSWSAREPIVFRNGAGEVTRTRTRAPATTEAAVGQLAAALNHAAEERRSDARPRWHAKSARQVNRARRTRIDAAVLADMLAFAAEPSKRRNALHAFLVASICTLGRPGAIVGISTDPARGQWRPGWDVIDLNPAGRAQNRKLRARLPVLPLLGEWLASTLADTAAPKAQHRTGGWLVNYYGRPVKDVDSAWRAMLVELKLPLEREWRKYLLRHSLATILRGAGVPLWELAGWMGHSSSSMTETYAVEERFPHVQRALQHLLDDLDTRVPGALHRKNTGASATIIPIGRAKMPSG